MSKHSTFRERVEFGLETIPPDRTVVVPLRDILFIHQTLGELVRFFHQRDHYPDLTSIQRFLGFSGESSAAFNVLREAYYQRLRDAIPRDIDEAIGEGGRFEHPLPPDFYDAPQLGEPRSPLSALDKVNHSGFTIVFSGPDFCPEEFLRDSDLEPSVVCRGDSLRDGSVADESWLEFADVHEGHYPLDIATEALDFLQSHREEFLRLARFPGVVTRTLNFFGDAGSCSMDLKAADIALLNEMALHVSICAYSNGGQK